MYMQCMDAISTYILWFTNIINIDDKLLVDILILIMYTCITIILGIPASLCDVMMLSHLAITPYHSNHQNIIHIHILWFSCYMYMSLDVLLHEGNTENVIYVLIHYC